MERRRVEQERAGQRRSSSGRSGRRRQTSLATSPSAGLAARLRVLLQAKPLLVGKRAEAMA